VAKYAGSPDTPLGAVVRGDHGPAYGGGALRSDIKHQKNLPMDYVIPSFSFAVAMFAGMLICIALGRLIGKRHLAKDPLLMSTHTSVDSAAFALYGLLLAFTFSGAPTRLNTRRELIGQEANAIKTVYLRLDLLHADQQPLMRQLLRDYLDSRLKIFHEFRDLPAAMSEYVKSTQLQYEIWTHAVEATRSTGPHPEAGKLLLPALNDMINITTTRTMAERIHPPPIIFGLLFLVALVCSLLAGYGMAVSKRHSWLHIFAFTMIAVFTVFVILEIEYPRMGVLTVETRYDQVLVDLRQSMNEAR